MCLARSLVLEAFFLWLLLASDACHCLWPYPALSVCVLRTQPVVFTSCSATFYASAILPTPSMSCCRFGVQAPLDTHAESHALVCFFVHSACASSSLALALLALSAILISSLYIHASAQTFQNFALDSMTIMFFTSSAQIPV